jgi:hypothetical protein
MELMKLPAVRFIRIFDPINLRMINVWDIIRTQEQLDSTPRAIDCAVIAPSFEEPMVQISRSGLPEGEIEKIAAAFHNPAVAKESVFARLVE